MPRQAPTVNGTPATSRVSFRFIDFRGDMRSVSYECEGSPLPATIEAVAVIYSALSNANLWSVEVTQVYGATASASVATNAVFTSVDDIAGVLLRYLPDPRVTERYELPSPISAVVLSGEVVDFDVIDEHVLTVRAMLGITADWLPIQTKFSERRDSNKATRL